MEVNILVEKLKAAGLTEKEARVYIAALETHTAGVARIAANAKMNRVTTYTILEKLSAKGFVSESTHGDIRVFTPLPPEIFVENIRQKAEQVAATLPFLKSLLGEHPERPTVRFFQGLEAVKQAYQETLRAHSDICNYANSHTIRTHWPEYDVEYVRKRKERQIFLRGIAPADRQGRRVQSQDHEFFRETRLLPLAHFRVENEINIFDNKFLITSFEPSTFAILVESAAVVETQRQIFEIIWSFAKPKKIVKRER